MKVIYGIDKIGKYRRPVVALGVFDGVHKGHRHILGASVRIARRINGTAVALTFDPHPQKEDSLCSLAHRLRLIGELGVNVCIVVNFNRKFAQIPAGEFIRKILSGKIGAAYICVGKDFRFGRQARGHIGLFEKSAKLYNFKLKVLRPVLVNNRLVSSTSIRKLILEGDLKAAQRFLGRRVSILGNVIRGASLARKLGFPTANINPHHEVVPPCGIYLVEVILKSGKFFGVCSIGNKPTLGSSRMRHIEVHIFDFSGDIYAQQIEVIFVKKIREQERFPSLDLLAQQIQKDITLAKSLLSLH